MCIEYNECHYGGMYNVYVKRIFVVTEIVHMNEKTGTSVSTEKEKVKESQSRSVTPSLDTPSGVGLGASQFIPSFPSMGQRNQYRSQGVVQAPSVVQMDRRGQSMGRGRGQGSQAETSETQGRFYAITPQTKPAD